ncbi:MAG: DNA polymerase III subunit delta [Defluviitaleaceae bacterium]|nr:DNA polymerase III subunit delta [Defluviitaleaceae bacterium]
MQQLKSELSRGEIRNLYVLFGEERFLVLHYAAEIEAACGVAKTVFDGAMPVAEIIMAAETVGFSAEKRLIFVRNSGLFAQGRKEESEKMADYFAKIPADTTLVFTESEIDKRTRAYKTAAKLGAMFECAPLASADLTKWLGFLAKKKGKNFASGAAQHFLRTCGSDMSTLANEMEKLVHFCGEKSEISARDIDEICTQTLEARIFDLTKAMGAGRTADALKLYRDMLFLKESPYMILTMMIRQLRIILLCMAHTKKNTPRAQIAKELKIMDFVIGEALSHGRRFTEESLIAALEKCSDTDLRMKTGLVSPEIGVEMLLISIA